jgi:hypothetical protein
MKQRMGGEGEEGQWRKKEERREHTVTSNKESREEGGTDSGYPLLT